MNIALVTTLMSMPGFEEWMILLVILSLIYFIRKGRKAINNDEKLNQQNKKYQEPTNESNSQLTIPDTCPHCKNPNSRRIRLCEWCGNQII